MSQFYKRKEFVPYEAENKSQENSDSNMDLISFGSEEKKDTNYPKNSERKSILEEDVIQKDDNFDLLEFGTYEEVKEEKSEPEILIEDHKKFV